MRPVFLFLIACLIGCSPAMAAPIAAPQSPAGRPSSAAALEAKTVALVVPAAQGAYCSGVWISDVEILTANHCVADLELNEAVFYVVHDDVYEKGSTEAKDLFVPRVARLKARDSVHDLALIAAPTGPVGHSYAVLSGGVRQGDFAQTMGQSIGLLWWSYSSGDVAAIRTLDIGEGPVKWVQTTTPISPGNSGGGLFDAWGDLIGVCHGNFTRGQSLNIFVHLDHVREFLKAAA